MAADGRAAHPLGRDLPAAAALAVLVGGIYLQSLGFGFVFDDGVYVTLNPAVARGLTWEGVRWAFTGVHAGFWHPLTWLSHMLDVTLFGLRPAGHHLTATALHAANAALCFAVLRAYTGAAWPAFLAAALFAAHPLRAESVAYVSQRKDVLAVLFWLLTMAAWLRHLRRPSAGRYAAALGVFALGLMAKPMLVTLPFALLLLDYWPLGRLRTLTPRPLGRLALEKAPFLLLSVGASVLAYVAEHRFGALSPVEPFPLGVRLQNVLFSYAAYVGKTLWPSGLAAFYPHPGPTLPGWTLALSGAVLAGITALALRQLSRRPFLAVGWAWYLGILVPVIGFIQIGDMGMGDRYTYLPSVGVFVMAAWAAWSWVDGAPRRRALATAAVGALVLLLAGLSVRQARFWRDDVPLFAHTLEVTGFNPLARFNHGIGLARAGRLDDSEREYRRLMEEDPSFVPVYYELARLLESQGRYDEAVASLRLGVERHPLSFKLRFGLGGLLRLRGDYAGAGKYLEEAVRLRPAYPEALNELGILRAAEGRLGEAERYFLGALAVDPDYQAARDNLPRLRALRERKALTSP